MGKRNVRLGFGSSSSDPKKVPRNSMSFLKGGLWKELSHGLRTIEDSPLTTTFLQKQQKQW